MYNGIEILKFTQGIIANKDMLDRIVDIIFSNDIPKDIINISKELLSVAKFALYILTLSKKCNFRIFC